MKKSLLFVFGLGAMMASCTSDEPIVNGEIGAERQVEFTLNLPDGMATRSTDHNSWVESGKGGVSNNMGEDVTFNVALYLDGNEIFRETQTVQSSGNHTSATFRPTLIIGETYHLVAYAEFDTDANSIKLDAIPFKQAINDEKIDEYFVQTNVVAAPQLSAELKRPYGKLRLLADDWQEAERQFGSHIESISVTYNNGRPNVFDATTGLYGVAYDGYYTSFTSQRVDYAQGTFTYTNAEGTEVTEAENTDYKTIFVDYIPVNEGDLMMPFTITVKFEGGQTFTRDFRQDIPVHRNWLTTLKGNLFTMDSELTLYIEENFDSEVVRNYNEDIEWIFANGGTYTLTEDLTLEEPLYVNGNVILDLNGNNIDASYVAAAGMIRVNEGASLTIKGEGKMTATDTYPVTVGGGTLTIEGGEYEGIRSTQAVYVQTGVAYIKGGTYKVDGSYLKDGQLIQMEDTRFTLNCSDTNYKNGTAKIVVTGGTFQNGFNPADNAAEGTGTNFVAEGYSSLADANGVNYMVVKGDYDLIAYTSEQLQAGLNEGKNILMCSPFIINATASSGYGATGFKMVNGGVLDGNGNSLGAEGAETTWDSALNTNGGTIKNISIVKGFRGIFITSGANAQKVILENVTIDGTTYTISCDQGGGKGLEATNCTFNGWTSFAKTLGDAKFVNCNFGEGNGYSYCRPYAPTVFKNCKFEEGFTLDATKNTNTLINCTVGGVAVTQDNITELLGSDAANAVVK